MNNGDLLSESDWEMMIRNPDTDQVAWNYGTTLIDDFFAPDAPFWAETSNDGRLIASDVQTPFHGQAGSGMTTGGGSDSGMQMQMQVQTGNSTDSMPTRSSSEVLDAVVSTNQQRSPPASLNPAFHSPSVIVNSAELPTAQKAEISKMSTSLAPPGIGGEHDHDIEMQDSSPLPFARGTTPVPVGREGVQTLPYGTDGTAGRTPHSARQHLQPELRSSNVRRHTFRTTPAMTAAAAFHYSSSPYERGRHTQSTDGAESLRRDMEQHTSLIPTTTAAIPFPDMKTLENTPSTKETATRANEEPDNTPAKTTKKRTTTRKSKAPIENQMFAVRSISENGTPIERLAKGSELGFKSPAPKAPKAPKRKAQQQVQNPAPVSKRNKTKARVSTTSVSAREIRLLTGVEVNEKNTDKRKTRASSKAGDETADGPDAGKAVRQRRLAKK